MWIRTVQVVIDETLTVECKEITWEQYSELLQKATKLPENVDIFSYFYGLLTNEIISMTTNLTLDQIKKMGPSVTAKIYAGIKEANQDFLVLTNLAVELVGKVGLSETLQQVKAAVLTQVGQVVTALVLKTRESTIGGESPVPSLPTDTVGVSNTVTPLQ